jgi:hypothetical protein
VPLPFFFRLPLLSPAHPFSFFCLLFHFYVNVLGSFARLCHAAAGKHLLGLSCHSAFVCFLAPSRALTHMLS